jgi:hypothetical protein
MRSTTDRTNGKEDAMKKTAFLTLVLVMFLLLPPFAGALAPEKPAEEFSFTLPQSLTDIGESAFENTAARIVYIPDAVLHIAGGAFAKIPALQDVFVPSSIEFIAEDAFFRSGNPTIHGEVGSYALDWAERHGHPVAPENPRSSAPITPILRALLRCALGTLFLIVPEPERAGVHRAQFDDRTVRAPKDWACFYPIDFRFP